MAIGNCPGPCEGCGISMLRKELGAHSQHCEEVTTECPFHFARCTVRLRRKDLAAHMQAAQAEHLALALLLSKELGETKALLASLDVQLKVLWANAGRRNCSLFLKRFEPIDSQPVFHELFSSQAALADFSFSLNLSKSPHELRLRDGGVLTVRPVAIVVTIDIKV